MGHLKPVSALRAQTARNSSFLPVLSPISLCEGPLDLLTPLLPPNLSLVISCGGSFPPLVSDGPRNSLLHCSAVALSSFMAFTAVYMEMVPTAPLHLVCSLLLLLSL